MTVGAVILAAGFGTRLAPLTDHTPKPLLRVGDAPVVSHLLDRLAELRDLEQVVVVVNGQHPEQWKQWNDARRQDVDVVVLSNQITANERRVGAVADMAAGIAKLAPVDHVVVMAGDNLLDEPLQPHLDAAVSTAHPVLLCRDLGDDVPAGRFGEVTVDTTNLVTEFREKPDRPRSPLVATCTYVLPGSIGEELATYLAGGNTDSPGSFIAWLAGHQPVFARTLTGHYFDVGNHQTLADARRTFRSP